MTVPAAVTAIGDPTFNYCESLARVYFAGDAPAVAGWDTFHDANAATVYYVPGTTGWGSTFAGRPAVLWNPRIVDPRRGTNGLAFVITGTADIPIAVETATDLLADPWMPLETTTLVGGALDFTDEESAKHAARYHRIATP